MGAKPLKRLNDSQKTQTPYATFDKLDGQHPWMKAVPMGFVPYRVRELREGKVAYFNYPLAKEMGLIPVDHPTQMSGALESKLLETFSLQIINEFDQLNKRKVPPSTIKPNRYMASRYLQLQHNSRSGKTSGDGRGIWNGTVQFKGKTWDVSSRGTGVTCLAPGSVEANRPLKTGGGEFGYGCGQAEIDELYGAAILAEIMHLQGIQTERVLCIIDLGKGYGIGVRAGQNLLRPAHLFVYLKQNRFTELKAAVDYFLDRQIKNSDWSPKSRGAAIYEEWADQACQNFAEFTAKLDIDYIFAWLDWDGDNVLASGGIIDYGSVRQFGIRHDRYRYDDVERFSTNLNEQRTKAKYLIQNFVQIADCLKTGSKKPLKDFARHPIVEAFNKRFSIARAHRLLYRMGFNRDQRELILKYPNLFNTFDKEFSYFERAKVAGKMKKVADGVNHPALFNLRAILRELPEFHQKFGLDIQMPERTFFDLVLSSFAKSRDARLSHKHARHIRSFQKSYVELLRAAFGNTSRSIPLGPFAERAKKLNREDRITGNALIQIVDELISQTKKGMPYKDLQALIDQLIFDFYGLPEIEGIKNYTRKPKLMPRPDVYNRILDLMAVHSEDI